MFKRLGYAVILAAIAATSAAAQEARAPAVSDFNLYGGPSFGTNQDTIFGGADLNMAIPLGDRFGLQIGGTPNIINSTIVGSAEAHLFMRDPALGMIGVYGSYTGWGGWGGSAIPVPYTDVFDTHSSLFRAGLEAEFYAGPWTLSALGGWKNSGQSNFFFDSRLSFYPSDSTKIYVGYEFTDRWLSDQTYFLLDTNGVVVDAGQFKSPSLHLAKIGVETILPFNVSSPLNGTSIYAEGQFGNEGYASGTIGVRFRFDELARARSIGPHISYNGDTNFGGDTGRSLKDRDRNDYVLNWLPKDPKRGKYQKNPTVAPAACTQDGSTCDVNDDASCCSGDCLPNGGNPVCGTAPPACTPNGNSCDVNDDAACCSGDCLPNGGDPICGAAPPACTPGGGACSLNDPGACCSLTCNNNGGNPTCASVCTPAGGACSLNDPASCCSGTCNNNGGNPTCGAVCSPAGSSCNLNDPGACCSQTCLGNGGNPICAL